jgi:hypothetical protein
MMVTRASSITGLTHTREVPVTEAQLNAWYDGARIQDAMPNLSAEDREFILSGITPEEWNTYMVSDEDDQ